MGKRILIVFVLAAGCQSSDTTEGCQTDDPPGNPPAQAQPEAVVDPDDRAILDAVFADLLANPELSHTRDFYGSGGTRVLFDPTTFPAGYVPQVPGYQFAPRSPVPSDAPRMLTVDLRWFRGRPMLPPRFTDPFGTNKVYRDKHKDWQGVEVCLFNGGGGGKERVQTIGGCSVYYDVRADAGRWLVTFKGAEDP